MFTISLAMLSSSITLWLTPPSQRTALLIFLTSALLLLGTNWFFSPNLGLQKSPLNSLCIIDFLSSPLLMLSLWLIPVSILASAGHLHEASKKKTNTFMSLLLVILLALLMTFTTTNLLMFFLGFETTLAPTLFLITRWGAQKARMEAGYYFIFYTLISSLPLFMALLFLYNSLSSLDMKFLTNNTLTTNNSPLPLFCLIAFLVKIPIFMFHLWLPKAHVEAPVAGSMMLAAILLKLGGYGLMRLSMMFWGPFIMNMSPVLIPLCCWGGLLTSIICISQTDLKSLMAYSSVSHMSLLVAGLSTLSCWAIPGSMIMMIAHGVVSSALFCLANMYYERSTTRNLMSNRGLKALFYLLPMLWLMFACANLGLPPLPKAIGELLMFASMVAYNMPKIFFMILATLFTAIFSLTLFQYLKSGCTFNHISPTTYIKEREHTALMLHLIPLLLMIPAPNLMT